MTTSVAPSTPFHVTESGTLVTGSPLSRVLSSLGPAFDFAHVGPLPNPTYVGLDPLDANIFFFFVMSHV